MSEVLPFRRKVHTNECDMGHDCSCGAGKRLFTVRGETTVRWSVTVEADNSDAAAFEALHLQDEATLDAFQYEGQEHRVTSVKG